MLMRLSQRERKDFLLLFILLVVLPVGFYLLGGTVKASITSFNGGNTFYEELNSWMINRLENNVWLADHPFWDPLVANNVFVIVVVWAVAFSAVSLLIVKRKGAIETAKKEKNKLLGWIRND